MTVRFYTKHGGRTGRYKEGVGRLSGVFDPWEQRSLDFRSENVRALWLLRRAEAGVESLDLRPSLLQWVRNGTRHSFQPEMAVRRASCLTVEAVIRGDGAARLRHVNGLREAASIHGLAWRATPIEELTAGAERIANMEHIRQVLTVSHDDPLTMLVSWVPSTLARDGSCTRAGLRARLDRNTGQACAEGLDAAIFRLYFAGRLWIDLERRFEDESIILGR